MNEAEVFIFLKMSTSYLQDELYSDFLDLSLSYSVEEGKLTLGIIRTKLAAISAITDQCELKFYQLFHPINLK